MSRTIFNLVGRIRTEGIDGVVKGLADIDKKVMRTANKIDKFGRDVSKLGMSLTKLTAPITAVAAGVTALALKTGQYADKLLDLNQITGLSTDTLQEFESVARDAGVDFDALTKATAKLSNRLPEIAKGTGRASEALTALGVSAFDSEGKVRSMDAMFPEIIGKLQSMENITERNALAQSLFGRSLKDIAPVLGMTAEQIDASRKAAHDNNLISRESIEAANKFRQAMERLKAQFAAVGREIAVNFLPILQDTIVPLIQTKVIPFVRRMSEALRDAAEWFNGLSPEVKDAAVALLAVAVAIGPVLIVVGKMISMVKTAAIAFKALTAIMLANPIGTIIALIGLLVAAGIYLYKNWDTVSEKMSDAWDAIAHATQQAVSYVKMAALSMAQSVIEAVLAVGKHVPGLRGALESMRDALMRMQEAEALATYQRRALREETKLARMETQGLKDTVDAAKAATAEYSAEVGGLITAKEEDVDATGKQVDAEAELAARRAEYEAEWTDRLRRETSTRAQLLEYEYQQALALADELGADRASVEQYYTLQRIQIKRDELREIERQEQASAERQKQVRQETASMAIDALNMVFDLFAQNTEREMTEIDRKAAAEREAIDQSMMNEEEKAAAKELVDAEADAKKKELMREQAKRDKAAAIFATIINTFQAVAKALTLGFPLGLIMAVLFGALGAAQIALIAAQPLPELAEGGLIPATPGGVQATIGEGGDDEIIMPLKTGIAQIVDGILRGIAGAVLPPALPAALAGAGAGSLPAGGGDVHFHVGTLVADDSGLRQLERMLLRFRREESIRKGEAD